MVDSDRGITNLHVPSDVIIDASMPARDPLVRADVERRRASSRTPSSSSPTPRYAALYAETIDHCREHGAFDPATMGTTPNVGLMAQKAEEYGSHDKTFEIAAAGHRARRRRRRRDAARARRRGRRHLAHVPDQGRARSRTGSGSRSRARARPARPPCSGSTRRARTTPSCWRRSAPALDELDTDGLQIEILRRRRGDALHARARPRRRGHDLGHRQRPARLPHRPVPDPRARHEREDALDRAADERRRAVRDRRRRLGARSTSSSSCRENHLRWDSLGEFLALGGRRSSCWPTRPSNAAREGARPTRSTARPGRCSRRAGRRRARSASSTTAAATSTSRCTGRRSWPRRPRTPSSRRASRRSPSGSPTTRRRSSPSSTRAGRARRHRRLLPPGPGQGRRGDAPERDAQRGRGRRSPRVRRMSKTVTVTGAAGAIGYALLFRIASGQLLGPDEKVACGCWRSRPPLKAAEGTAMELDDCAFPLLPVDRDHRRPERGLRRRQRRPARRRPPAHARAWSAPTCWRPTARSSSRRARRSTPAPPTTCGCSSSATRPTRTR